MSTENYIKTVENNFKIFIESKKPEIISAFNIVNNYDNKEFGSRHRYGRIQIPNGSVEIKRTFDTKNEFDLYIRYNSNDYLIHMNNFRIYVNSANLLSTDFKLIKDFFNAIDLINRYEITNIKNLRNSNKVILIAELDGKTYELTPEEMKYIIGE